MGERGSQPGYLGNRDSHCHVSGPMENRAYRPPFPMNTRLMPCPREAATLNTDALRASFLLDDLFVPGEVGLVYTDLDRAVVGSAIPISQPLELGNENGRASC